VVLYAQPVNRIARPHVDAKRAQSPAEMSRRHGSDLIHREPGVRRYCFSRVNTNFVLISLRVVSQSWKQFGPETFHLFIEVWPHGHEVHAAEPQLDQAS
jgi:hypothetical protein